MMPKQSTQFQPIIYNAPNINDMIRCKLPSPFNGGYSDIIVDPQNFLILPPSHNEGIFSKVINNVTKVAHKATIFTKNFIDARRDVICLYCTAHQTISNDQANFYCCNCSYLNNRLQEPIRKPIYCGKCDTKQDVDLGTTWFITCSHCSKLNIIPTLRPLEEVPPGQPCLREKSLNQHGLQVSQNYNEKLDTLQTSQQHIQQIPLNSNDRLREEQINQTEISHQIYLQQHQNAYQNQMYN